jgi:aminobenzoyl-glutamate transport protein
MKMTMPEQKTTTNTDPRKGKNGFFASVLDKIEVYGNKLPDPVTLFVIIALIILTASFFAGMAGVSAVNPATKETITAVNLLSGAGLVKILTEMVKNFANFPPMGLVLVVMIGVGLAEASGLISALMRRTIMAAPSKLVIPTIIFVAIMGNAAGDAAFIVLPPIAAMVLMALGFNPLVGLVVSYASVAGGFAANLVINMLDALVAGFTQVGAQILDKDYVANPAMNYYFLIVSTVLLIAVSTFVTYRITIPRLGTYEGETAKIEEITSDEKRGLRWAGISTLIYIAIISILSIPSSGILRNPETGSLVSGSPFMAGLVPIITFLFLIPALFYGMGAKTVKSDKDVANMLGKSMGTMGPYIVLAFVAAQMIAYFNWSNLGPIIAIKGAEFLQAIGLTGLPLVIGFILVAALINLIVASSSAKWAILAPVFVPMFMLLGYDPAFTQIAYRIGDSITNPITPMLAYFAILLSFAKVYNPKVGMGTLISALVPYSVSFAISWIILLVVWFFLGLPLGPDGNIFLNS